LQATLEDTHTNLLLFPYSDVYNAVIDGADAVMLSGESSVGKYPVVAVNVMNEIVRVAQAHMPKRSPSDFDSSDQRITETICHAACTIASEFKAVHFNGKIVVITNEGRAARLISKYRPDLPILAFSESERTVRELAMVWGVRAHHSADILQDLPLEERAMVAIQTAKDIGYLEPSDDKVCIISASMYTGAGYFTGIYDLNALKVYQRSSTIKSGTGKSGRASMI
jgi:pyruvate kinase